MKIFLKKVFELSLILGSFVCMARITNAQSKIVAQAQEIIDKHEMLSWINLKGIQNNLCENFSEAANQVRDIYGKIGNMRWLGLDKQYIRTLRYALLITAWDILKKQTNENKPTAVNELERTLYYLGAIIVENYGPLNEEECNEEEEIKEEVDGWRLIDLVKEPVSNPEDSDNK